MFYSGIAVILGRTYQEDPELYLIGIDCDSNKAIEEFTTTNEKLVPIGKLSEKFMVEQHKDESDSLHVYFFSPIPFPNKGANTQVGLEVKGSGGKGYMITYPSIHANGYQYEIVGTHEPCILTKPHAIEMIQHLEEIFRKNGLEYLDKVNSVLNLDLKNMIKSLDIRSDLAITIHEGERHSTLVSIANSILFRHLRLKSSEEDLERLRSFFIKINEKLCSSPLSEDETRCI